MQPVILGRLGGTAPVDEAVEADAVADLALGRKVFQWLDRELNPAHPLS